MSFNLRRRGGEAESRSNYIIPSFAETLFLVLSHALQKSTLLYSI